MAAMAGGCEVCRGVGSASPASPCTSLDQCLTLLHFSAQPEPFLTQSTPWTTPSTLCDPLRPHKHPLNNP